MKKDRQSARTHTSALERKIELAAQKYNMDFGGNILLALSGGADSCALFFYLIKKTKKDGTSLSAAHLNHMIRGAQAERDMRFCERICAENGIKLFLRTVDIPALSKERGRGIEEVARECRYSFFDEILSENADIKSIMTAHNSSDNAETVLFNLARGSGIRGLMGIPPVRAGRVLRPLILCAKNEILAYCDENKIEYVTDSTNTDTKYTRNFIRSEILPKFERLTPAFESAISRAGDLLREDNDFIECYANEFLCQNDILSKSSGKTDETITSVSVNKLEQLHAAPFARVMIKMHRYAAETAASIRTKQKKGSKESENSGRLPPLEQKHIEKLANLLTRAKTKESRRISLPGGVCAECEGGVFSFLPDRREKKLITCPITELKTGENYIPQNDSVIILRQNVCDKIDEKHKNIYKLSIHTVLSSDKIKGKLYIRCRQDGDSYRAGGITRRLKKLFSDAKLPLSLRRTLPVLCDDEGIVWVPGFPVRDGCGADNLQQEENPLQILYYIKRQTDI